MTFGSLFSGIGGIDLGLQRAGMTCKWQVEIDDFCQKVLTKHWPDVPKHKDIKEVGRHNLETVDLIAGGFPCQPFSIAGKRKGTKDNRFLWSEMLRIIQELRPSWVFAENVLGILSINDGMVIEQVLSSLEDEGYETMPPFIIPACAVDAPHRRDRVWIMGRHTNSMRCSGHSGSFRTVPDKNTDADGICQVMADTDKQHGNGGGFYSGEVPQFKEAELSRCEDVSDTKSQQTGGVFKPWFSPNTTPSGDWRGQANKWLPESGMGRVANGIPGRMDRLKGLGNAVVPQATEHIGKAIMHSNQCIQRIGLRSATANR